MAINDYKTYLYRLKEIYEKYGYSVKDSRLQAFIDEEGLDTKFHIRINDIRMDLEEIHRDAVLHKKNPFVSQGASSVKQLNVYKPPITDYEQYLFELEKRYLSNDKKSLVKGQILNFIRENRLDRYFNITVADVQNDIKAIEEKYNVKQEDLSVKNGTVEQAQSYIMTYQDYCIAVADFYKLYGEKALLSAYIRKFIKDNNISFCSANIIEDIQLDLIFTKQNNLPASELAKSFRINQEKMEMPENDLFIFEEFKTKVTETLLKHQSIIKKHTAIKGLLLDYFPNQRKEINILLILVGYGILDELNEIDVIDSLLVERYTNRIVNEHGIDISLARKMVEVWCYCYGHQVLQKKYYKCFEKMEKLRYDV